MFLKNHSSNDEVDTFIGQDTKLEGILNSNGTIRIDGEITGNIHTKEDIIIGEHGKITGDVTGKNVIISGMIKGNITAKNELHLSTNGKILGDIHASSLIIESHALFEGTCSMQNVEKDPLETLQNEKIEYE